MSWKCHVFRFFTNLEEACENVELKHRNEVVACEVDGGFEGHGLQARADEMHFVKALSEDFPRHYRPATEQQVWSATAATRGDKKVFLIRQMQCNKEDSEMWFDFWSAHAAVTASDEIKQ